MVDISFILGIATSVFLLLGSITYILEFSFRYRSNTKFFQRATLNMGMEEIKEFKKYFYQSNLKAGRPANGAYYTSCSYWRSKNVIGYLMTDYYKESYLKLLEEIDLSDEKYFPAYDPVPLSFISPDHIEDVKYIVEQIGLPYGFTNVDDLFSTDEPPEVYKYDFCTNSEYHWYSSRLINGIILLLFVLYNILNALGMKKLIPGLIIYPVFQGILLLAFGIDVLGVSGDLGLASGVFLILVSIAWIVLFFLGKLESDVSNE
jgi:hypothetical protein